MAQSVPPSDIAIQPVFNAPYDKKSTYHNTIINSFTGSSDDQHEGLGVDPVCGVLDPKEATLMVVNCDAFGQEDTNNDYITVEWINTPIVTRIFSSSTTPELE